MADNVPITKGSGTTIAADEIGEVFHQRVKVEVGADGVAADVSTANPMPVSDAGGTLSVDDGAASLTVDAPLATPVAVRLSDGAEGIGTTAKRLHVDDGGSTLSVDDGAGSLTVDALALGGTEDAEATANGSIIGLLKRLRKLLEGTGTLGLAAGTAEVGKVKVTELAGEPLVKLAGELPAGTQAIGKVVATNLEGEPKVKAIGDAASGAADSGNPVKTAAVAQTALPAATTAGNRINAQADKYGRLMVANALPDTIVSGKVNLTNETSTEVLAAPGVATRLVVTSILVTNASTTVATRVEILDETTGKLIGNAGVGGGFQMVDRDGLFIVTANKPVKAKCLTTGANVDVFIKAFKLPE